ncbi:MAG: hypothetical protein DRK00_04980 [Thermoprotei archaeon]|nr:MAG: hypothetical protein DRK00_04980 [Thermoprotei archaeon]
MLLRRASGSILPPASLYGAINAIWGLTLLTSNYSRELMEGFETVGIASWAAVAAVCILLSTLA